MEADELVRRAIEARKNAYAFYSGYPVGAAVLTASGNVYTGCNVENASTGLTVCAERTAIQKAVSEGDQSIVALAVVTEEGASPCGACRQVLLEFGAKARIYIADMGGAITKTTLAELLPVPFTRPNG